MEREEKKPSKCYYVGSNTSTTGNEGLYLQCKKIITDLLRVCYKVMNVNMVRTKASSEPEGSVRWTVKWPLVLQQTN